MQQVWEAICARVAAAEELEQRIIATYQTAVGRLTAKQGAVLEYRCKTCDRRLLHAWHTPDGVFWYTPPYRLSPQTNAAESTEAGRNAHTSDGDRHWHARAGCLDAMRGWGPAQLALQCHHIHTAIAFDDLIAAADRATPGKPARLFL
jgi:hypothetical protein